MRKNIVLLLCLLASGFVKAQSGGAVTANWLTHQDSTFSFKYPPDWLLKLPGTNTRFIVTSKPEDENDHFRENINCITRVLNDPGFKISSAEKDIRETLETKMTDFKLLASGYTTWNGSEALYMEYSTTQKAGEILMKVHIYQQMAVVKGVLFTLTYTAADTGYSKYWNIIAGIIQSVKISK